MNGRPVLPRTQPQRTGDLRRAVLAVMAGPALVGLLFGLLYWVGEKRFWGSLALLGLLAWVLFGQMRRLGISLFGPRRTRAVPWGGVDVLLLSIALFLVIAASSVFWNLILPGVTQDRQHGFGGDQAEKLVRAWTPVWDQLPQAERQDIRRGLLERSPYLSRTPEILERLCIIELARQRWVGMLVALQYGLITVIGAPVLLLKCRGARPYQLGLHGHRLTRNVLLGLGAYLLVVPLIVVTFLAATLLFKPQPHLIEQVVRRFPTVGVFLLTGLSAVVIAPLSEELLFRGILLPWLRRVLGPWQAILGSSLAFAALHSEAWPAPIPLFVLALFLGYLAYRTNSLVAPITLHATFNAVSLLVLLYDIYL